MMLCGSSHECGLRLLWDSQTETQDTKAVQQEAMFYCAGTDSADSCPKAEPQEQRGLALYILASRLQNQEATPIPYMIKYYFIG
jgi:hypothetical protein